MHSVVSALTQTFRYLVVTSRIPLVVLGVPSGEESGQRVSVISTASSNTTSGIVSDRVHSLDDSEGKKRSTG